MPASAICVYVHRSVVTSRMHEGHTNLCYKLCMAWQWHCFISHAVEGPRSGRLWAERSRQESARILRRNNESRPNSYRSPDGHEQGCQPGGHEFRQIQAHHWLKLSFIARNNNSKASFSIVHYFMFQIGFCGIFQCVKMTGALDYVSSIFKDNSVWKVALHLEY